MTRHLRALRIPLLLVIPLTFVGAPCTSEDPAPPPAADAGAITYAVYQTTATDTKVDALVAAGEAVSGRACEGTDARAGGGFFLSDPSVQLRELTPSSGGGTEGYRSYALLHDGSPQTFRTATTCVRPSVGTSTSGVDTTFTAGAPATAAIGKIATATASCGTSWLVGGGFAGDAPPGSDGRRDHGRLTRLAPDNNAWAVRGRGLKAPYTIAAQAVCARRHVEVLYPHPTASFVAQPGTTAEGMVSCPSGWTLLSGGFAMDDDADFVVTTNLPAPVAPGGTGKAEMNGWIVGGKNLDSVLRTITVIGLCARYPVADTTPVPALPPPLTDPPKAPKLDVSPNPVDEFCLNGQWPNAVTIKNVGTADLTWSLTPPSPAPNLILSPKSGTLAPDATTTLTFFGSYNDGASFTVPFTSNGGSANLVVNCK